MPIIAPAATTAVLDTANTILNSVRHRLNDALPSLYPTGGKVLDNTSAFTQQCFNDGYRKFQEQLANLGYTALVREVVIEAVPAVTNTDPASQTYMDWFTYYDGSNYSTTPVLPDDLVHPLKVWERWTGQNAPFPVDPMEYWLDGMPTGQKGNYNGVWEWRENAIYMPGSLMDMDWRIRYVRYLPDIVDVGSARWYNQTIPIPRCLEPLSLLICAEFAGARTPANDQEAAMQSGAVKNFSERGEGATKLIFNRDVKVKERVTASRQPRSGRGGAGMWGGGY